MPLGKQYYEAHAFRMGRILTLTGSPRSMKDFPPDWWADRGVSVEAASKRHIAVLLESAE